MPSPFPEGGSPPNPLNPRSRLESILADMRLCALQDRVLASGESTPVDARAFLTINAVLVEMWANVIEDAIGRMP